MEQKRKRKLKVANLVFTLITLFALIGIVIFVIYWNDNKATPSNISYSNNISEISTTSALITTTTETTTTTQTFLAEYPRNSQNSKMLGDDVTSEFAVLIDNSSNEIVAYKKYSTKMYPASLTKIMTLIVAVENTENFEDTKLITAEMIDPMVEQDATRAGFIAGETPTINDLLYGLILPSGADASIALAEYVAGSETAFVEMMNQKCEELGLKNTHFTNCVGLHDDNHYSTVQDIAIILQYAMKNDICREVLTAYQYTVPPSEYNPEGLLLTSTMFQRMTGTEMPGVTVMGGKTGFTDEAGQCLASFAQINGKEYILILGNNLSRWNVIYDTLSIYSIYGYGGSAYIPPQ